MLTIDGKAEQFIGGIYPTGSSVFSSDQHPTLRLGFQTGQYPQTDVLGGRQELVDIEIDGFPAVRRSTGQECQHEIMVDEFRSRL